MTKLSPQFSPLSTAKQPKVALITATTVEDGINRFVTWYRDYFKA